jgi:hypothetical protein
MAMDGIVTISSNTGFEHKFVADYVTDTQALIKFMMGKKVISEKAHQALS